MIRMETNIVLKYFEPLDNFIKIRLFTREEVEKLLQSSAITNKQSFQDLVLNACVIQYNEVIVPSLSKNPDIADHKKIEEKLLHLCTEINPDLDLARVTIPVTEGETSEIHLLERKTEETRKDFHALKGMEHALSQMIVGQNTAIDLVSKKIKKAWVGLRDPRRPIATFLFVGQTGVGKTELARQLVRYLYDNPAKLIRIDCSEYSQPHEYAKLIGAPPGYIGHSEGGILTDGVMTQGTAVVLLDEIEKSDPRVHHLMLQIMDEGLLTDNKGRRVNFKDTIVVMTSNVGSEDTEALNHLIGFSTHPEGAADARAVLQETLSSIRKEFTPEFINRIDSIVPFNPIGLTESVQIAELFLNEACQHANGVPIELSYTKKVPSFLAEKGYNPRYGAREIRRTVETEVEDPLSELLIEDKIHPGDRVRVNVAHDRLTFHRN